MRVNDIWTPEQINEFHRSFDEAVSHAKMDFPTCRRNLADLHKMFTTVGLPHYLLFGTLLGAFRERDFIRGDHDTDIGILDSDSETLARVLKLGWLQEHGWKIIRAWDTLVSITRDGEYVDIYIFSESPRPDMWWSCEQYWLEKKFLQPPGTIEFWGETYQTVNAIGSYLSDRYGADFWTPKNEQATR